MKTNWEFLTNASEEEIGMMAKALKEKNIISQTGKSGPSSVLQAYGMRSSFGVSLFVPNNKIQEAKQVLNIDN